MMKTLYLFVLASLLQVSAAGQSAVSGEGRGISVWAGLSVSAFNPDYGCVSASPFKCSRQLIGLGPYLETNPFLFGRIGAIGEARFSHWNGPSGLKESNFLAGPQVTVLRHGRFQTDLKFLAGRGDISWTRKKPESGGYFVFAPGAAVEYRVGQRISFRGDYEYQLWSDFKSSVTGHTGLTPNGFTIGVSYKLL